MPFRNHVPDPLDLFNQRDLQQNQQLAKRPVCDYCDHPIQDDFYYEIDCEKVCKHCLDTHFRRDVDIDEA